MPGTVATIAILGAGPAGLTLGRLLERANISYVIFERDESATWAAGRGGSGTLDIHKGSGQLALEEAGLIDEFKSLSRGDGHNIIADADGKVLLDLGEAGDAGRPEIDRKDLRAMLLRSVPDSRIHWGRKVQEVKKMASGEMQVVFADGSVESGFRLVVGADGAWSKARSVVTSEKPIYCGISFLTTKISPDNSYHPEAEKLSGRGNYVVFSKSKMLSTMRLGDKSYYTAAALRLPQTWASENRALLNDAAAMRKWLLEDMFTDYATVNTDIIRYSDGDFHIWPIYYMNPDTLGWKSVPGITLIGDAAHVTTPFEGEGVNCSMHDSYLLAQQILKHGIDDLAGAVAEYEEEMFPRGADLIRRSNHHADILFRRDAPYAWLREMGVDV